MTPRANKVQREIDQVIDGIHTLNVLFRKVKNAECNHQKYVVKLAALEANNPELHHSLKDKSTVTMMTFIVCIPIATVIADFIFLHNILPPIVPNVTSAGIFVFSLTLVAFEIILTVLVSNNQAHSYKSSRFKKMLPFTVIIILISLFFLSLSGIYEGYNFLVDKQSLSRYVLSHAIIHLGMLVCSSFAHYVIIKFSNEIFYAKTLIVYTIQRQWYKSMLSKYPQVNESPSAMEFKKIVPMVARDIYLFQRNHPGVDAGIHAAIASDLRQAIYDVMHTIPNSGQDVPLGQKLSA